jgi:hypothetical protein
VTVSVHCRRGHLTEVRSEHLIVEAVRERLTWWCFDCGGVAVRTASGEMMAFLAGLDVTDDLLPDLTPDEVDGWAVWLPSAPSEVLWADLDAQEAIR